MPWAGQDGVHGVASTLGVSASNASFHGASGGYPPNGVHMPSGLDLSFGITPMTFEKINLIGSTLSEQAIYSLVLSVPNITYLDLRGNNLNAAFGWRLVKAMQKRYLMLEFCNGVHLRGLRNDTETTLNLSGFNRGPLDGHMGMYGIEVVGAIFLAHFLRLNSSLTELGFRRNDVQKDGAKALAQSLLGNPKCELRTIIGMGASRMPEVSRGGKPGIDFAMFRAGTLTTVHLSRRVLDDDDFVFLEEWLRRYQCVTDLDISYNPIWKDGVRKLVRFVKETTTLLKLNCVGLPVDLEGTGMLARAVAENETLEHVALPLGPCQEHPDRQQMLQQLGVGIARHPKLASFGLALAKLREVRDGKLRQLRSERMVGGWNRTEASVYLWFLAAMKPQLEDLHFGSGGKPLKDYPSGMGSPPELWPALIGVVYDCHRTLLKISIMVPRGYGPLAMELMRALTRCQVLKTLSLLGYASAVLQDKHMPPEWAAIGAVPRWLLEDRVRKIRPHWQALYGLLNALPHLDTFNDVMLGGQMRDQPEHLVMLLMQCLEGVAGELVDAGDGDVKLSASLTKDADVDAFCDVLRLLSRTPILVDLKFTDKKVQVIKEQQFRLVGPLSGAPAGEGGPRFTHSVAFKNHVVSEALLERVDAHAPIREFCYEKLDDHMLEALFKALCTREKPLPVEKIKIEPKWNQSPIYAKKRWWEKQRKMLHNIQAALVRSERFVEIDHTSRGSVTRDEIAEMPPEEFAEMMSGLQHQEPNPTSVHPPQLQWRCFPSYRAMVGPTEQAEDIDVPLPLNEEAKGELGLSKLSLCMADLRPRSKRFGRSDEFAESSRALWEGPRRLRHVGAWDEFDPLLPEGEEVEDPENTRYHWRENLRIGTAQADGALERANDLPFAESLIENALKSLFTDNPQLTSLDLRGNGLTRDDANLILDLLEQNKDLETLNMMPVVEEQAKSTKTLRLDGTGIDKSVGNTSEDQDDDPFGDGGGGGGNSGEVFAVEALEADVVRLDEGDGWLFYSLVTPNYFPELQSVEIRNHEIPDTSLTHITDALLNMPTVCSLQLSELLLSSRGATLLLCAVVELAPRLVNLNGLPLKQLTKLSKSAEHQPLELPEDVQWNDFSLGAMARLSLWPHATFPAAVADNSNEPQPADFHLQGRNLTDVGLKGFCIMLRHFAGLERTNPPSGIRTVAPHIVRVDLSGNAQISDATVADICHTLQHPTLGSSLRHSLRDLSVRSCPRLRSRSAFELLSLVQHVREVVRDSAHAAGGTLSALGGSLQMLNGMDLATLQSPARTQGGRLVNAPPMLLRTLVEQLERGRRPKANAGMLSECDVAFFASMLHTFAQIPYCHVHIVVPPEPRHPKKGQVLQWGRESSIRGSADAAEAGSFFGDEARPVSNDSPFPPPDASAEGAAAVQAHLDAARRLFEACPIATQLRLSAAPCIPDCEDLLLEGDAAVLASPPMPGDRSNAAASSSFGRVQQRLQDRAARRRRGKKDDPPRRQLYVNNINSQRLHDCFRTLYGQDDLDLMHTDILPEDGPAVSLPSTLDISQFFGIATSVDMQHLELRPAHLERLSSVTEMPVLTHVNLNHNHLGDTGVAILFNALVAAGCSVVHVALSNNNIGDTGAMTIAANLPSLPRLTSLELCDNTIQEKGSIALAEAIDGAPQQEDMSHEESVTKRALPMLSVDLRGNRTRELGAMYWAEVVSVHPTLQFLCLAANELGRHNYDSFRGLVYAAVASADLRLLDLRDNFPVAVPAKDQLKGPVWGPPPPKATKELLAELPPGEFDPSEVSQGVFIRRQRGGGAPAPTPAAEKRRPSPTQPTPGASVDAAPQSVHSEGRHSAAGSRVSGGGGASLEAEAGRHSAQSEGRASAGGRSNAGGHPAAYGDHRPSAAGSRASHGGSSPGGESLPGE